MIAFMLACFFMVCPMFLQSNKYEKNTIQWNEPDHCLKKHIPSPPRRAQKFQIFFHIPRDSHAKCYLFVKILKWSQNDYG